MLDFDFKVFGLRFRLWAREYELQDYPMLKTLVSGVAGFIGSHLAERLIKEGFDVIGLDSFEDYYPKWIKEKNIESLLKSPKFTFLETNLLSDDLWNSSPLASNLKEIDYIFHQAAQAGVRRSWGKDFQIYTRNNILITQKLLEITKDLNIKKFIYASSSSVYGDVESFPIKETATVKPLSPYGVSKLAGENLCQLYHKNFNVPITCLRYFTVYGPRQRPDMAFHKFIKALIKNEKIHIYGSGKQTRDFTYISDVIKATLLALNAPSGEVFNIGGGNKIGLMDALSLIEALIGKKAKIKKMDAQKGDVHSTWADIKKANSLLGYKSKILLEEGLKEEILWIKEIYKI